MLIRALTSALAGQMLPLSPLHVRGGLMANPAPMLLSAQAWLLLAASLQVAQFPFRAVLLFSLSQLNTAPGAPRAPLLRGAERILRGWAWMGNQALGSVGLLLALAGGLHVWALHAALAALRAAGCSGDAPGAGHAPAAFAAAFFAAITPGDCPPAAASLAHDVAETAYLAAAATLLMSARVAFSLVHFYATFVRTGIDDGSVDALIAQRVRALVWAEPDAVPTPPQEDDEPGSLEPASTSERDAWLQRQGATRMSPETPFSAVEREPPVLVAALPPSPEATASPTTPPADARAAFEATTCSFCMEDFSAGDSVSALPCSHSFHASCVLLWLRREQRCPLCTRRLVEDDEG